MSSEIAFFGGSFTALPRAATEPLLQAAAEYVRRGLFSGIRVSTRPDAVDEETVAYLQRYHVKAVELGAQSMDEAVLLRNGRGHTPEDTRRAAALLANAGLELGLQMMTGLPGDSDEGARKTALELAALHPATMRIYPTLVLRNTRLAEWYERGEYRPVVLEDAVSLCSGLLLSLESQGIRVIRLGLHASESLAQNMIAGPWHPAFRELCEGELYFQAICRALGITGEDPFPGQRHGGLDRLPPQPSTAGNQTCILSVPPGCISKAAGHRRRNLLRLEELGYSFRVCEDAALAPFEVTIHKDVKHCF